MGGRDAIRGFEYQFLRTLEYLLAEVISDGTGVSEAQVEGVVRAGSSADPHIVDFALISGERTHTVAQVKSGAGSDGLTASEALEMLIRLLSHNAERYLVVTNRPATPSLRNLLALMQSDRQEIRDEVLALVGRAKLTDALLEAGDEFWELLRRADVVLDGRDIERVRRDVQDRIRTVRHRVAPSTVGWDATGLLTGYLVWEVMAKAAGPEGTALAMTDLLAVLAMDAESLKTLMPERDWAVPVTPGPRATDIARPELLARIAEHLPTPVPRDAAPVCLLAGLSGIGKSSLAAAWADDNAYAYAAIMWIDATTSAQLTASFNVVADWLQARGLITETQAGAPVRERVFAALARSAQPWLMVFDNCSDQTVVRDWIPPRGHGHTIVTSTDQSPLPGPSTAKIEVRGMTDAEATQLLARRTLGNREPRADEQVALQQLAARLHHWPLALELAATYLVSTVLDHTHGVIRGVAGFERLLQRAMQDRPSVPVGYPETVVGAITLTWQRIIERTGPAESLATDALRSAAFLASRQIPMHLLLACATRARVPLVGNGVVAGLASYTAENPPIGEVLREVRRDSLVVADKAFPMASMIQEEAGTALTPSAQTLGVSVMMNDIVQFTVRGLVEREGRTGEVLPHLAFYTQAWLQYITSIKAWGPAVSFVGHAVELSEHVIEQGDGHNAAALLWGNTASILAYLDEWDAAVRYLSVELAYLDSLQDADPPAHTALLRIQTLVALAQAMYQRADNPRETVHQIIPLLERLLTEIPIVVPVLHDAAALSIRAALTTVEHLLGRSVSDPRLTALQSVLHDFRRMVPITDEVDWYDELHGLNAMMMAGNHAEARAAAEAMLLAMNPDQPEYLQALRMMVEACVHSGDWPTARDVLGQFADVARARSLRRFEASLLIRNVGTSCLFGMMYGHSEAFELFERLIEIAEIADGHSVVHQAGDRDLIAVFRAFHRLLDGDVAGCSGWLDYVDLEAIDAVERTSIFVILHRLLRNWCTEATRNSSGPTFESPTRTEDQTYGSSPHPVPDTVLPLDEEDARDALLRHGPESAPARAVGAVQVMRASGQPPRDPMHTAVETCLALRILGLPAQINEVVLQILRDDPNLNLTNPEHLLRHNLDNAHAARIPHHTAWVESSGHLVDPVVPQLYAVRAIATNRPAHRHPVVIPLSPGQEFLMLRRDGLAIAYQNLGTYDVRDVARTLPAAQRKTYETNAIFVALHSLFVLGSTGDQYISIVERHSSELTGLIIRPERLTELMQETQTR